MAKPRKLMLEEGTVILSGFPKEIANELEAWIANFRKIEITVPLMPGETPPSKQFKDKAIGLKENNRQWELVVVGYDINTKEASIEEVKNAGDFKQHALSVFQQEVCKRGLI